MGKEALVVKRAELFKEGMFDGFLPLEERDLTSVIMQNHFYHERGNDLENNPELQQVIPYIWIVNSEKKEVFLYKRAINQNKEEGEFREKRYMNKFSGGVGGHIDRDTEEGTENPIERAMMRELKEEVEMNSYGVPRILGYINDDTDSIGKVHFGLLAILETSEDVKARLEEGLGNGRFYSIDEAHDLLTSGNDEVEGWTRISWPVIKNYLQKL